MGSQRNRHVRKLGVNVLRQLLHKLFVPCRRHNVGRGAVRIQLYRQKPVCFLYLFVQCLLRRIFADKVGWDRELDLIAPCFSAVIGVVAVSSVCASSSVFADSDAEIVSGSCLLIGSAGFFAGFDAIRTTASTTAANGTERIAIF